MEFRILGPLEVVDNGRPIELRAQKQRALLAILLLREGEWAAADALVEALWGGRPPPSARFALRNYVAGLRRAIGPGLIVSRDGGYQLAVGAEQLDLSRFEYLVEESRAADGRERLELLQQALALWRGPALADLLYEPFATLEAPRLEELRLSALEELIDTQLALGGGPELVERLQGLVAEQPYRERLRGQLMLALYRGGRQVEALECYRQTRTTLVEELGIEPGTALHELEQAILRQDPSLQPAVPRIELPPLVERRKTVTVLFAELVVREPLDPELQRRTSVQALANVRAVLATHGASIEQRASEELMAVFGLPLAHEDDVLRAARAALELQAERGELDLRVALESGEVLAGMDEAGHGFVSGTVVPATRHVLQQAQPGETLVGAAALRLLGGTAVVQPVPGSRSVSRLLELAEDKRPVSFEVPFAGRGEELAALRAAFTEVASQKRCRLLLIVGEAGIGKTRLAAEFVTELEGRATIASGRCLSYGQALTYWPLVEALRSLGAPSEAALERLLAGRTTSVDQLAGIIQQALERVSHERPLIVLVEDLHWAEHALLDLLEIVTELSAGCPIFLLCLARPEFRERHPDWARELEQASTLTLEPLSETDSRALLGALPRPPVATERDRVLALGAGNPLFLEELSAFLGHGEGRGELPPRLQLLLQARLDQLPEQQRIVLTCAALEGVVFHRGALKALLPERVENELSSCLAALLRTRLVSPAAPQLEGEKTFRFRHQLIRDAAYGALAKADRAELHERFADWLAQHRGERTELEEIGAYHLEQAALIRRQLDERDPVLEQRAVSALAAAGERALTRVDRHAAASLGRRALMLLDEDDPRVPALELELGLALTPLAEFAEASEALAHAERCTADPRLSAQIRIANLHVRLSRDPEGVPQTLRRECASAIPLFARAGDHQALAHAWCALAEAEWFDLRIDAATRAFELAARHAELAGDTGQEMLALEERTFFRGSTVISYADTVKEAEQLVSQFPDDPIIGHCLNLGRAFAAYDRGDTEVARPLIRGAIAGIGRWGYPIIAAANDSVAGVMELLNGNLSEAESFLLSAVEELERRGERAYLSRVKAQLASLRVAQGRHQEALELSDEASLVAGPHHRFGRVHAKAAGARACVGLAELEQAKIAAEEAVALAETTDSPDHRAVARLALAEALAAAEEFPDALAAGREAVRLWTELDRKLLTRRAEALVEKIEDAVSPARAL